jgi:hypothetical protein
LFLCFNIYLLAQGDLKVKLKENTKLISPNFHIYLDNEIIDKKIKNLDELLACHYQGHIVDAAGGDNCTFKYRQSSLFVIRNGTKTCYSRSLSSVICGFEEILVEIKLKLTPKSKYSGPSLFAVLVFAEHFQKVCPRK